MACHLFRVSRNSPWRGVGEEEEEVVEANE